ncbi:MAG: FTR1 family protein [Deltaproteobacteria bacterium]|nr:FTR1 family protein [Deltaproteobacteria bacterium]
MVSTLIIVFREFMEAGLIVGIVLAASRHVTGRGRWVWLGASLGAAGSVILAWFWESLSDLFQGNGQAAFQAGVLFLAVAMLGWHNLWMGRHGRQWSAQMNQVGHEVERGARPLYWLTLVVWAAVMREGGEMVLFLYGILAGGEQNSTLMLVGGLLGMGLGVALSMAVYFGLMRLGRRVFVITSWLIVALASGLAAQGAGQLLMAGYLPSLGESWWDSSRWLPEATIPGQILRILLGYMEQPAGIQVVFYLATFSILFLLTWWANRPQEAMR